MDLKRTRDHRELHAPNGSLDQIGARFVRFTLRDYALRIRLTHFTTRTITTLYNYDYYSPFFMKRRAVTLHEEGGERFPSLPGTTLY